ncbi:hypothetical protein [Halorientalis halophila]|uniref:hypothetical protein n=1 Tax=Halorientalis halophila TaxID=3108499 RepID=UPI00300BBE7B
MIDRSIVSTALLVLAAILLLAPAIAPVQPVLYHDLRGTTLANETQLETEGIEVIAYENLSDRGQRYYEATLRNGGQYVVSGGAGAEEFDYPAELESDDDGVRRRTSLGAVAIERPTDSNLPESEQRGPRGGARDDPQMRTQYDLMSTRTDEPPLGDTGNLTRLLSVLAGVLALGTGGYLRSKP